MSGRACFRSLCIIGFVTACTSLAAADGITVEVIAGKADVADWVAEVTLDLAAARELLGAQGRPDKIAVYEFDASGKTANRVASQVDPAHGKGLYTVAWRVPGKLAAGAARSFVIRFEGGAPVADDRGVTVVASNDVATVTNGDIILEHAKGIGGMIRRVTVGGATAALTWNDKIYDGTVYYLPHQSAERMDVVAKGPLRAAIETEGAYTGGEGAGSKPRAAYRFTTYAGLPFTRVEAVVTQDYAHQWMSVHFIEMQIGAAGFTHFSTDHVGGALAGKGQFKSGAKWASVYNDNVLIATCASTSPGIWDSGSPKAYGGYVRSGVAPMTALRHPWKAAILWGPGAKAVENGMLQRWSDILADPPKVRITLDVLQERVAAVEGALKQTEAELANLSGRAWASAHVAITLGRVQEAIAREKLATGEFRQALDALEACEKALDADAGEVQLLQKGTIHAGVVMGHPYLGNDKAVYLWSKPGQGAGLISIFDRDEGTELLKVDPLEASLWEIAIKKAKGGASFASEGTPCKVTFDADDEEGRLHLRWSTGVTVEVEARLGAHDPLLRARINANAKSATHGLVTVAFPVINGMVPRTPDARDDMVLDTHGAGWEKPSPLASGKVVSINYPSGMSFTALTGGRIGLYFAEEDPHANRKQLTWTPMPDTGSLDFSISHPVLNWGGDQPVSEYESPGDLVCGPFHGDWYDAAVIYRKWALTAPWCAKGPIHERADYPQWLAEAPYWTIGHLGSEFGIQNEIDKHDFFGIPTMVSHTYSYWTHPTQADGIPELWPPRLGSAGFKQAVADLQQRGIRIVPYILGWLWDRDTESWRTEDAFNKGALWLTRDGALVDHRSYGGGQSLPGMCPASDLWRRVMLDLSTELVGRYGVDGIYFDFLTGHTNDCYNTTHGHAICGGDFWTKAVHGLYEEVRQECKKLNPDFMMTGEDVAEFCIDVHDTFLCSAQAGTTAPLFLAVYHGYANLYGGAQSNKATELTVGRWWLMGGQNGWNNLEEAMMGKPPLQQYAPLGRYYKTLLKCRWEFATPYLAYGRMLRPPRIEGNLPTVTEETARGPCTVKVVEGSAWKAPDGTVGIFFLNHDKEQSHQFTWTADLAEGAGIDPSTNVTISRWTPEAGVARVKQTTGGTLTETMTIEPLGIISLKLEVAK